MDLSVQENLISSSANEFIEHKGLADYLKSLPSHVLEELHTSPAPCLATFRVLPRLAKHIVQRMLYVEIPVPQAIVESWISTEYKGEHAKAVDALTSLKVWNECPLAGGLLGWALNHKFRHNLKVALLGGGKTWTHSKNLDMDKKTRSIKDLDGYALSRWEALLQYLANRQAQEDIISGDTIACLMHAGLLEQDPDSNRPSITNKGFQFLLLDTASQVWYFLVKYLETIESRQLTLVECLSFLFTLSFGVLGKDYSTEGIGDHMQIFIQHLREFGLIYQRSRKVPRYYPTRLAIDFYNPMRRINLNTEKHKTGFIFVETNFRLYAYTESAFFSPVDLQIALVGMFTEFLYRFPNLVVGVITRDSIRQALRNGIKGDQIISYLQMHCHTEINKGPDGPVTSLPPTVVDQIRLWEIERSRFTFKEGVLYNQFLSQQDYEVVKDFAQENNVLLHFSDQKRTIVVHADSHNLVRKFWKKHSKGVS